jgi:hypothetical protein
MKFSVLNTTIIYPRWRKLASNIKRKVIDFLIAEEEGAKKDIGPVKF